MLIIFDNVPAIRAARAREVADREAAFKGLGQTIGGLKIRSMTIRDFLILEARKSPFVTYARPPAITDLAEFLWLLSPQIELWHNETGWRKSWLIPSAERLQAFRHGRRVRKIYSDEAARKCFAYVDLMFMDSPFGGKAGGEQYITYLAGWYDAIRSEYHCTDDEFFALPLPKLFACLRAMELRKNPEPRLINRTSAELRRLIVAGLNTDPPRWTAEQIMRPDFQPN